MSRDRANTEYTLNSTGISNVCSGLRTFQCSLFLWENYFSSLSFSLFFFPFFIVGNVGNSSNKREKILGDRFQIRWGVIVLWTLLGSYKDHFNLTKHKLLLSQKSPCVLSDPTIYWSIKMQMEAIFPDEHTSDMNKTHE